MKPTIDFYPFIQGAFEHFNRELFDSSLPNCLIIIERNNAMAHFKPAAWVNAEMAASHEIALNPTYFLAFPKIVVFQTLVHEMTHLWQHEFGNPGRGRYHNKEWANKMEEIGLMPSNTGEPGGKKTGDHMNDFPIANGAFMHSCCNFLTEKKWLPWADRFPEGNYSFPNSVLHEFTAHIDNNTTDKEALSKLISNAEENIEELLEELSPAEEPTTEAVRDEVTEISIKPEVITSGETVSVSIRKKPTYRGKNKYTCGCGINMWGRAGLNATCMDCDEIFEEQ